MNKRRISSSNIGWEPIKERRRTSLTQRGDIWNQTAQQTGNDDLLHNGLTSWQIFLVVFLRKMVLLFLLWPHNTKKGHKTFDSNLVKTQIVFHTNVNIISLRVIVGLNFQALRQRPFVSLSFPSEECKEWQSPYKGHQICYKFGINFLETSIVTTHRYASKGIMMLIATGVGHLLRDDMMRSRGLSSLVEHGKQARVSWGKITQHWYANVSESQPIVHSNH